MTNTFGVTQRAFGFYEDGTEAGSVAIAAENTNITRQVLSDSNILLRVGLQESGAGSASGATTDDYALQLSKNGGAYATITTSTTNGIQARDSSNLTEGNATTQRLSAGTGSFIAGEIAETGTVIDWQLTANNHSELLYSLVVKSANVAVGDTLDFRVLLNGATITYSVTPRITVAKTQALTPGLVTNSQTFYAPTVTPGAVALTPILVTLSQIFYSPTIAIAGGPHSVGVLTRFGFEGYGVRRAGTFAKGASQALTAGLVTNSQTFFAPTVAPGVVDLTPGLVTNSQTFYAPTVAAGSVDLTPGLVTNAQTFYAPTVAPGAVNLQPSLVTNTQTFYAPTVAPGVVNLTPDVVANSQTFYSPTISAGAVNLQPGLISNSQVFYSPIVAAGSVSLAPSLVTNSQTFFAPTITAGLVNLRPGLVANGQTFYSPTVTPGVANLAPDLVINTQTFFAPNVAAVSEEEQRGSGVTGRPRPPPPQPFNGIAHGARILVVVSLVPGKVSAGVSLKGARLPVEIGLLPGTTRKVGIIAGKATGEFMGMTPEELFLLLEAA